MWNGYQALVDKSQILFPVVIWDDHAEIGKNT